MDYYIGIDVGTGSARAGLFDRLGAMVANESRPITLWRPQENFVEQSSEEIWQAIVHCVKTVLQQADIQPGDVKGLGFDATCSLVAVDAQGRPVSVSPSGEDAQNVVVWMDHRALEETEFINNVGEFPVFDYVGGKISPEMQTPKLLWLKKHLPDCWEQTAHFFDLPDYLTYRATGSLTRSLCSMTCKWTYLAPEAEAGRSGWHTPFFEAIGLGDLAQEDYQRIGTDVQPMGAPVGNGLSAKAAAELGLLEGTAVGVSIIDAHAGGIGMVGMALDGDDRAGFDHRLALIGGTSSCHMAVAPEDRMIPGVWGPYYSSMVPGLWLNEGGQSATGALVDHIVFNHGATAEAQKLADEAGCTLYQILNERLETLATEAGCNMGELTRDLHVCPYFHGNRSPRANPHLVGMISGLRLSNTLNDLARLYLATIQAIAYGTRHIIEEMNAAGYRIDTVISCGGGTKNPVFLQQHADITGCQLILPKEPEAVVLGSAMLGAVAAGTFSSLQEAMQAMSRQGNQIAASAELKPYHDSKYKVFHQLYQDQLQYEERMRP